ncbi:MAG TPA: hypothetical protein VLH13_01255, partial [Methanomassiliicoccales archaeon]|nr:hypothetical protein [Methanomassiliicoccales archaeon]
YSAVIVLLARFSISQMDVPTRQAYVMTVVRPEERSAASGITGIARTIGQSASLFLVGMLLSSEQTLAWAFFLAGGVKICYDVAIYHSFKRTMPLEEGVK